MKCQIMFTGNNKKNILICCLLKILPRLLSIKEIFCFKSCFLGKIRKMAENFTRVPSVKEIFCFKSCFLGKIRKIFQNVVC